MGNAGWLWSQCRGIRPHLELIWGTRCYFAFLRWPQGPSRFVVIYGCESWTIKKVECQRIDAFELWCWKRLLRVAWTTRGSNQSILKETSPECSLEGLMLKLKLQYFGHLIRRTDSFEETLMLGKIESRSRRGWQRMRWLDGITDSMDVSLGKTLGVGIRQGGLASCDPLGCKEPDPTMWLNWTQMMNM